MDFKGQYYCERLFQILVVLFGIVGFIVGYLQQDFRLTFLFLSAGGGISAVVCNGQRSTRPSSVSVARCSFSRLLYFAYADLLARLAMVESTPIGVA